MLIHSHTKDYEVHTYDDFSFMDELKRIDNRLFALDKSVYELYESELFSDIPKKDIFLIDAVEENKTIETALSICEEMTKISAKRNSTIISFGGGIVQDITGFAANILYRGIKWKFVPTTLLAACDSCIGGKTSLNYKKFKNLLGTFFAPDDIYICPKFFLTLSQRDYESGLGEVLKFNFLTGKNGVENVTANLDSMKARDPETVKKFLLNSLQFKKKFIEEDEFDVGIRVYLNFAHTFGHAFETVSDYAIPHGTAVAMGTIVANRISMGRNWLKESMVNEMENSLLGIIHVNVPEHIDFDRILQAISKDKKQIGSSITTVLLKEKDDKTVDIVIEHETNEQEIRVAIEYMLDLFK